MSQYSTCIEAKDVRLTGMRSANGDGLDLGGNTSLNTRRRVLEYEALFDGVSELLGSL